MTEISPTRAAIAALVGLVATVVAVAVALALLGENFSSFLAVLSGYDGASLGCVAAAWAAVAMAGITVLLSFLAWLEDPEEDGLRRRGFPRAAPLIPFALTVALVWAAFACDAGPAQEAGEEPLLPAEPPPVEEELLGGEIDAPDASAEEPLAAREDPAAPNSPQVIAFEAPMVWPYAFPLIDESGRAELGRADPMLEEVFPPGDPSGAVREMLCGKAWVAFAGSASQEGPPDRNDARARLRAELALGRAEEWLSANSAKCSRPPLIGINLGQHLATVATPAANGSDTAHQRQLLVVYRDAAAGGASLSPEDAAREFAAFYADPEGRRAMLGSRLYAREPEIFFPVP